jgi:hypothetical protein
MGHYVISGEGVSMDPEKVKVVMEWGRLTSLHEIQSFLGLADYYHQFIEGFSKLSSPLTALTTYGQMLVKKFSRS